MPLSLPNLVQPNDEWVAAVFWGKPDSGDEPLGQLATHAAMHLLFLPGFTVATPLIRGCSRGCASAKPLRLRLSAGAHAHTSQPRLSLLPLHAWLRLRLPCSQGVPLHLACVSACLPCACECLMRYALPPVDAPCLSLPLCL